MKKNYEALKIEDILLSLDVILKRKLTLAAQGIDKDKNEKNNGSSSCLIFTPLSALEICSRCATVIKFPFIKIDILR